MKMQVRPICSSSSTTTLASPHARILLHLNQNNNETPLTAPLPAHHPLPPPRHYIHNRKLRQYQARDRLRHHPRADQHDPAPLRRRARPTWRTRLQGHVQNQHLRILSPRPDDQHPAPPRHPSRRTGPGAHVCVRAAGHGADV